MLPSMGCGQRLPQYQIPLSEWQHYPAIYHGCGQQHYNPAENMLSFMEVFRGPVEDDLSGLIRKSDWDGLGMGS